MSGLAVSATEWVVASRPGVPVRVTAHPVTAIQRVRRVVRRTDLTSRRWRADHRSAASSRASAPRSSPRCRRSPSRPARSTSGRASPTPTDRARCSRPRSTRSRGGEQPVPARARHPRAAPRHRRAPAALVRARLRSRHRGAGHRRRDRGDRRGAARAAASRATRWSPSSRTTTRTPRASRWPAPTRRPVTLRAARLRASTPTSCAPRSRRAPGSSCSTRRTTPPGKVFSRDELEADRRGRHRARPHRGDRRGLRAPRRSTGAHIPLATLPGMRDRTVTISSGGKTFSCTGWKIGWVCASPAARAPRSAPPSSSSPTSAAAPFQPAIAVGLRLPDDVLRRRSADDLREKRDRLCAGLDERRASTVYRAGGHVLRHRRHPVARRARRRGVLPVAARAVRRRRGARTSVFYDDVEAGSPLVRFAFCKRTR